MTAPAGPGQAPASLRLAPPHPGYCSKLAGWSVDRAWAHPHLLRLRAPVTLPSPSLAVEVPR